jgi:hypothetical protein
MYHSNPVLFCGDGPCKVLSLHKRYGHVVRVGPDHLSYTDLRHSNAGKDPPYETVRMDNLGYYWQLGSCGMIGDLENYGDHPFVKLVSGVGKNLRAPWSWFSRNHRKNF